MSIDYSALFTGYPSDHTLPLERRGPAVEAFLAKRLAFALQLPAAPISGGLSSWYTQYCTPVVNKVLSDLNESYTINAIETMRLVESLWTLRYRLVHEGWSSLVDDFLDCASQREDSEVSYNLSPRYKETFGKLLPGSVIQVLEAAVRDFATQPTE